jgi:beta-glucosidase
VEVETSSYSASELNAGKARIEIKTQVTNAGSRPGEEIVELYLNERGTSVARPERELKGFQRVALQPGESRTVEFSLGRDELALWNIDMQRVVEPGHLSIWVAGSSDGGTPAELTID